MGCGYDPRARTANFSEFMSEIRFELYGEGENGEEHISKDIQLCVESSQSALGLLGNYSPSALRPERRYPAPGRM